MKQACRTQFVDGWETTIRAGNFRTICLLLTLPGLSAAAFGQETLEARIGKLSFTHDFATGYPTDETIARLFNEIDFQRASQAYIWSIPLVSMAQWQHAYNVTLGAENGQIVFLNGYDLASKGYPWEKQPPGATFR